MYNGNKLIIIPRKIKLALTGKKNKIGIFPMVMPFCGEKG
jgi:hypothetical protein